MKKVRFRRATAAIRAFKDAVGRVFSRYRLSLVNPSTVLAPVPAPAHTAPVVPAALIKFLRFARKLGSGLVLNKARRLTTTNKINQFAFLLCNRNCLRRSAASKRRICISPSGWTGGITAGFP